MSASHPKPKCRFGRQHQWAAFVYMADHFACTTCGVEDDESWWTEDGTTYIGPAEPAYVDLNGGGWGLRRPMPAPAAGLDSHT